MEYVITALFGGYAVMGSVVAYLFRRIMKSDALTREAEKGHSKCREDMAQLRGEMSRIIMEVDRMAFQSILDAVIVIDIDGRIRQWNPTATSLFGYAMLEALGKSVTELMSDDMAVQHRKAFTAWVNDKRPPKHGPYEAMGRHMDGREFPIIITLAAWQDDGRTYCTAHIRRKLSQGKWQVESMYHEADSIVP